MRTSALCTSLVLLAGCGSSATDTGPTRYNFAVVDGRDQAASAGDATLPNRITSQLTRDPQGKFAMRVFDFLAPAVAYAQGLTLSGTPVANAIVCGREAAPGEPQVVPLCAFTLADGKAANVIEPGTRAGTFDIVFTAQVPSEQPVKDSTTVTVLAGPVTGAAIWVPPTCQPECLPRFDAGAVVTIGRCENADEPRNPPGCVVFARDQFNNNRTDYVITVSLDDRDGPRTANVVLPDASGEHTLYAFIDDWVGAFQLVVR